MSDGGPAFPAVTKSDYPNEKFGMSLRDYFAAKAMHCFPLTPGDIDDLLCGRRPNHTAVAKFCYELADAMLKAREK